MNTTEEEGGRGEETSCVRAVFIRQPFRNWQGQTLIRQKGLSTSQIMRVERSQIERHNCQIRKHVVMQQWNEIDRRQETDIERRGEERGRVVLLLAVRQRSAWQG